MRMDLKNLHRRGSLSNPDGRFEKERYESFYDGWDIEEESQTIKTVLKEENAKTILTRNDSPDIPFEASINPYRGCEHGCIYCYARPSHSYVNLSPGIDFETKIFYKKNAAALLAEEFSAKNYTPSPIALGANTDCYQPAERHFKITRSILETCYEWRHPLAIVSKSYLITRDADILAKLASENLVKVFISVTSLNKDLAAIMEPRAAPPAKRLEAIKILSDAGVPTGVMTSPIIPGLNDCEIESILAAAKDAGADSAGMVLVRLPYELKDLFQEWLKKHFPLKHQHIMNLIRSTRGGKEYSAEYGQRMTGTGNYAMLIRKRHRLAKERLGYSNEYIPLSLDRFRKIRDKSGQMNLF